MTIHPEAGRPAPPEELIDVASVLGAYEGVKPDPSHPPHRVAFGTSGHRGRSLEGSFNERHILAITQAICDHRVRSRITGPLFLGKDTHALSRPAERTALEVLAGNEIPTVVQQDDGVAPTPVISREILVWNRHPGSGVADGLILTPSHNPPSDGGIKYNPPNGGPAASDLTAWIQTRANEILENDLREVRRIPYRAAMHAVTTEEKDFVRSYVGDLGSAIDLDRIRSAGVRIGIDPLGGSSLPYVAVLADVHRLDVTVVNDRVDPQFAFMSRDHDGRIRMDCSSPSAMASLISLKNDYDIAFAMDPDADRHGIVTPSAGLMNPNHYLAVAIRYLHRHRGNWPASARIGKTLVSSAILDRLADALGRPLYEVPVGFKWFASGLHDGSLMFGGEESAGASFLRRDGSVWTTDKDGILLGLLAAEVTATTGKDPGVHYEEIASELGRPCYRRVDRPASAEQRARLQSLGPTDVTDDTLAGEPILEKLTRAPGNDAPIGGLKVRTGNAWFAARPSGTEAIYKIYAESFLGEEHLDRVLEEAGALVTRALG